LKYFTASVAAGFPFFLGPAAAAAAAAGLPHSQFALTTLFNSLPPESPLLRQLANLETDSVIKGTTPLIKENGSSSSSLYNHHHHSKHYQQEQQPSSSRSPSPPDVHRHNNSGGWVLDKKLKSEPREDDDDDPHRYDEENEDDIMEDENTLNRTQPSLNVGGNKNAAAQSLLRNKRKASGGEAEDRTGESSPSSRRVEGDEEEEDSDHDENAKDLSQGGVIDSNVRKLLNSVVSANVRRELLRACQEYETGVKVDNNFGDDEEGVKEDAEEDMDTEEMEDGESSRARPRGESESSSFTNNNCKLDEDLDNEERNNNNNNTVHNSLLGTDEDGKAKILKLVKNCVTANAKKRNGIDGLAARLQMELYQQQQQQNQPHNLHQQAEELLNKKFRMSRLGSCEMDSSDASLHHHRMNEEELPSSQSENESGEQSND